MNNPITTDKPFIPPQFDFRHFLWVYKKEQFVGSLYFEKGQHHFAYDSDYLSQEDAKPVSLDLPLTERAFVSERMFNAFEQVIPEGQDRKLLEKKADSANDFDLLPLLNDIYGDLQFSKTALQFDEKVDSFTYANVKAEILGENDFPNVLDRALKIEDKILFPPNNNHLKSFRPSGLSGFQHKLSVVMADNGIRQPNKNEASHYFIKPYHPSRANPESEYYLPHLAINEHLFMSFAKNELGFDVPWNGIIKNPIDEEYHYIVKRYDRYKGYKFSYEELATLVGLNSETKYQISSEQVFKTIKEYLTLKSERLILLKYYFYSMVIAHEDMHTKNLSVLTDGETLCMSPLYDIATTAIYQGANSRETALLINGKNKNIRPQDFYVLVDLLEVNTTHFDEAVSHILLKYRHKLPEYFDKIEKLPNCVFYERSRTHSAGRKPRLIRSISFAERLRRKHQERMRQLDKAGWYKLS
ncbi:MAG: type II toxin-antitoxin system HipA family toxin [Candidatus Parabeggiatoa sp.]|nr:type II toxin-antitoxin system HipA family toxin [Candidatus Parabeggiatoa sp.]